jgi:hypothetical protein
MTPKTGLVLRMRRNPAATVDGASDEINISGNQVLVALAAGFCLMGPLVWAFVRYWLFAL